MCRAQFFSAQIYTISCNKTRWALRKTFCKEILLLTKTTYYQLNQWDAADRVLRTDFNGDNAKIDAALHALSQKGALTQLKTFTTTAAVTGTADFSMDVGDITDLSINDDQLAGNGNITIGGVTGTVAEAKTVPQIESVSVDKFEAGAKVTLTFNVALAETAAETTGNYTFSGGTSLPTVASVALGEDGKTVTITTATNAIEASTTVLTVTNVTNFAGVAIGTTADQVTFGATADGTHNVGNSV